MRVIDDRGRIFGLLNVIDAALVILLLVLVPLGYGAFVMFRTPPPAGVTVTPSTLPENQPATVHLSGQNFRAFLSAIIMAGNRNYAAPVLVQSTTAAELKVPALPAGTYSVRLMDEGEELTRI